MAEGTHYDVIVIGAGPAGSTAAFYIARRGFSVLIIDKEHFPRSKPCGGSLTHRCLGAFPFDIGPVIERTVYRFSFSHHFRNRYTRTSDKPLLYTTTRSVLDNFLLRQAMDHGAELLQDNKVTGFTETFDQVLVHTVLGEFSANFIIGADGVNSITARQFQMTDSLRKGIGISSEIRIPQEILEECHDKACLDWGTFIRGYAWVFPKKDHLTIGVGGPVNLAKYLKPYYFNFLKSLQISDMEILSFRTFPIPFRVQPGRLQTGKILLCGDAAGFVDPLTGEGIYFAVRSGTVAAESVLECLEGRCTHIFSYKEKIESFILPELMAAFPIQQIFNATPQVYHRRMSSNDRMWRGFTKVLRGEVTYLDFREKLGHWKFLWHPIKKLAAFMEWYRRSKFRYGSHSAV